MIPSIKYHNNPIARYATITFTCVVPALCLVLGCALWLLSASILLRRRGLFFLILGGAITFKAGVGRLFEVDVTERVQETSVMLLAERDDLGAEPLFGIQDRVTRNVVEGEDVVEGQVSTEAGLRVDLLE